MSSPTVEPWHEQGPVVFRNFTGTGTYAAFIEHWEGNQRLKEYRWTVRYAPFSKNGIADNLSDAMYQCDAFLVVQGALIKGPRMCQGTP